MLTPELLQKVRRIEIRTRKFVDDLMSGQYRTQFKGQGVQFSDHRIYVPGDDVRHMDWKVSARTREPYVKKFEEERELNVLLLVDVSGSQGFGSGESLKSDISAEIAGMLAFAAVQSGDKISAILFSDRCDEIIPPGKSRKHVLKIIGKLLEKREPRPTNIKIALEHAHRLMKHRGVIFLISDFLSPQYELELKRLSRRHEVITIWLKDPREELVPPIGQLLLKDPETGHEAFIDTSSYRFQTWLKTFAEKREQAIEQVFKTSKVEVLKVSSHENYGDLLVHFFGLRAKKRGRR